MSWLTRRAGLAAVLGFASALPFVFLAGTLGVWISELGVSMATLGMLSWITLGYGFKLLWAPLIRNNLMVWMAACQLGLALTFAGMAAVNPAVSLGAFVAIAALGATLSATHDIAFEAWRIRAANLQTPVEAIMTVSQLGARGAGLVAGAGALALSERWGWSAVSLILATAMLGLAFNTVLLRSHENEEARFDTAETDRLMSTTRLAALAIVITGFVTAFSVVLWQALKSTQSPTARGIDVTSFTLSYGPLILAAITIVPILASQIGSQSAQSDFGPLGRWTKRLVEVPTFVTRLYATLLSPYSDLADRYGWRLIFVIAFVATYSVSWFSWAGFTMPLYINELGFSKNEVAIAARIYGAGITALGIVLGGLALLRLPRLAALLLGALLPIVSNAVYSDLATGGASLRAAISAFAPAIVAVAPNHDPALTMLYLAILIKNIISGIASAIFAGHLATLVSKEFAAVQCAIISSISFTTGTLLSAMAGEFIDQHGFAAMTTVASGGALLAGVTVLAMDLALSDRKAPNRKIASPAYTDD